MPGSRCLVAFVDLLRELFWWEIARGEGMGGWGIRGKGKILSVELLSANC